MKVKNLVLRVKILDLNLGLNCIVIYLCKLLYFGRVVLLICVLIFLFIKGSNFIVWDCCSKDL